MAEKVISRHMKTSRPSVFRPNSSQPQTHGRIKAVLFDLGDTLLNYGELKPYRPFMEAARQTYAYLKNIGQPVAWFPWYALKSMVTIRWRVLWSGITKKDFDSLRLLKRQGKKAGYDMSLEQYQELVWLWYEPLSRNIMIEPNLRQTLGTLKQQGIKMGIVSNTFVNACALNRDIVTRDIMEFFDFIYYSYEFEKRKPYLPMYAAAVETLGLRPDEIVFVGDRLDTDIAGAMKAGMRPVLKEAFANSGRRTPPGVIRISSIAELPTAIELMGRGARPETANIK